ILGDGRQTRDFTYVDNAVSANLLAMKCPTPLGGDVYNVGTGRTVSLLELVDALNQILGTSIEPDFGPVRAGDVLHSQASLERVAAVIGYQPTVSFEEGLRRTLASERGATR